MKKKARYEEYVKKNYYICKHLGKVRPAPSPSTITFKQ